MLPVPSVLPTSSQYWSAPLAVLHEKVTLVAVNVLPGAGDVI
jgi:hypothetical protein